MPPRHMHRGCCAPSPESRAPTIKPSSCTPGYKGFPFGFPFFIYIYIKTEKQELPLPPPSLPFFNIIHKSLQNGREVALAGGCRRAARRTLPAWPGVGGTAEMCHQAPFCSCGPKSPPRPSASLRPRSERRTGQGRALGVGLWLMNLRAQKNPQTTPKQSREEGGSPRERPVFASPEQGLPSQGAAPPATGTGTGKGHLLIVSMALQPLGASSRLGSGPSEPPWLPSGCLWEPRTDPDPARGSRPCTWVQTPPGPRRAPWPALLPCSCHAASTRGQVHEMPFLFFSLFFFFLISFVVWIFFGKK